MLLQRSATTQPLAAPVPEVGMLHRAVSAAAGRHAVGHTDSLPMQPERRL